MNIQQTGMLMLLKSAFDQKKYDIPEGFDLKEAIAAAYSHQITALVYYGAVNCGFDSGTPEMQQLFYKVCHDISLNEQQLHAVSVIGGLFDKNNIDYMPVKGTVIKKLYPKTEMRSMSDIDILIRMEQYDKIKDIMTNLQYKFLQESSHEFIWKKGSVTVEFHKCLVSSRNTSFYKYLGAGWDFADKNLGNCYTMRSEDLYIYLFIHLVKHYRAAGIGIKHVLDLWVYRNSQTLDFGYIEKILRKLELKEFHDNINILLEVWFENKESDEKTDFITNVIFNSGAYGTEEKALLANIAKLAESGKNIKSAGFKRFLFIIFLPYENMKIKYPVLNKIPALLPVFWIKRGFDSILKKRGNIKKYINTIEKSNISKAAEYNEALAYVGLNLRDKK